MKYLLDTCVVSDFVKGEPNTLIKLKNVPPNELAVSTITVMEIEYGIALNPQYRKNIGPVIHDMLASINLLDFSQNDAIQAAEIRALLKQQGQPIGSYDVLLAGTALNNKLIFVSSNTAEFKLVKNLALENWRNLLNH